MIRAMLLLILGALLTGGLGGCARNEGTAPPAVHYGEDVCARCGMIVSDDRFAAAIVAPGDGERFVAVYDDIGEMLDDAEAMSRPGAALWVHDFNTSEWIDARGAYYCKGGDLVTPMASGIAALPTRDAAERLVAEYGGEVVDFGGLIEPPGQR